MADGDTECDLTIVKAIDHRLPLLGATEEGNARIERDGSCDAHSNELNQQEFRRMQNNQGIEHVILLKLLNTIEFVM